MLKVSGKLLLSYLKVKLQIKQKQKGKNNESKNCNQKITKLKFTLSSGTNLKLSTDWIEPEQGERGERQC